MPLLKNVQFIRQDGVDKVGYVIIPSGILKMLHLKRGSVVSLSVEQDIPGGKYIRIQPWHNGPLGDGVGHGEQPQRRGESDSE